MSIHRTIESLLSPYLDGELSEEEQTRVEKHLEGCRACSGRLKELRAAVSAARELPEAEVPEDLAGRLSAAVAAEFRALKGERREAGPATGPWSRFPAYAAAAAVLVLGLAVLITVRYVSLTPEVSAPTQLERAVEPAETGAEAEPEAAIGGGAAAEPGGALEGAPSEDSAKTRMAPSPGAADVSPPATGFESPVRHFPPQVVITETEHKAELEGALEQLVGLPVAREAAGVETAAERQARRSQAIEEMVALAEKRGANPEKLRRALLAGLEDAPSDSVPVRAELIRHEGKDIWLILHVLSKPEDGVRAVAVGADDGKVIVRLVQTP